jgi:hypothetical protein
MGFSTFTGPLRAGTVASGAERNAGLVELAQSYTLTAPQILTSPAAVPIARLPAGSKITRFHVEVVTALTGATNCGLQLGRADGTANHFMTSVNTGAAVAKVAQATLDSAQQVVNTNNVGASDVVVTATPTAATANATAGAIVVTVFYIQRAADGSQHPASA